MRCLDIWRKEMKKAFLLNSAITETIAKMGHTDSLVIGDAGLPIPDGVKRIDLAVSEGIPGFMEVLRAVLSEQKVEKIILAEEIKSASQQMHEDIVEACKSAEAQLEIEYVSHEVFKVKTEKSKAVVRTGEFTPYANVILVSGVVF